jgi:hypothetical protein
LASFYLKKSTNLGDGEAIQEGGINNNLFIFWMKLKAIFFRKENE